VQQPQSAGDIAALHGANSLMAKAKGVQDRQRIRNGPPSSDRRSTAQSDTPPGQGRNQTCDRVTRKR
jgi:hypothetical protein